MTGDEEKAINLQAETVAQKIRHYLITRMGRTSDEAEDEEFYRAFCWALREEIMINWTATSHTLKKHAPRRVYYLSMEYMPGRQLANNISNIGKMDLVHAVLKKMNRDMHSVVSVEPDMGIGNGGLGRLASCFMDSLATQKYPALGYGMRYEYGIFEQELWCGVQVERPDCWLLTENPWEFRRDNHAQNVLFSGTLLDKKNSNGELIHDLSGAEEVRALPYDYPIIGYSHAPDFSVLTLRLWSTKSSPRNFQLQRFNAGQLDQASENTLLTDVLYPNDNNEAGKRIRLKQEFLLVSASLQDIFDQFTEVHGDDFKEFGDKVRIQINDTHPSLVISELQRMLLCQANMSWGQAWETVRAVCSYTNHTVMKEALEEWNEQRVEHLLPRQFQIIKKLNDQLIHEIKQKNPNDTQKIERMSLFGHGQIRMAHLAIYGSHKVNGVAALHSEILKQTVFKDFFELYPDRFTNVTNGVTQRRWLLNCNPELSEFITERIGDGWITDFLKIREMEKYAQDPASIKRFIEIKQNNKKRLLPLVFEQLQRRFCGDQCDIIQNQITEDALFDVHIKRIHEYKRQLLKALHALMLYNEIRANPESHRINRLIIFGGKAAPGYQMAKNIIRFIYCLARAIDTDPVVGNKLKIIYVENYNVSKAELIIPAANLSEQISIAGMEASGTGNMKFAMNGALTIGTDDGANVEMRQEVGDAYWPFKFGASSEENFQMAKHGTYNPKSICEKHPNIAEAVEMLQSRSLVENEAEHEALVSIYNSLLHGAYPDKYHILNDLPSYYETQKSVESLYKEPEKWAEYALYNLAGMGPFSTDESIKNYAERIWDIKPCPVDKEEYDCVHNEYAEHDRCKILQ